jgi:hypothetical protein
MGAPHVELCGDIRGDKIIERLDLLVEWAGKSIFARLPGPRGTSICCAAVWSLLADCVVKVVLHWWSEILRAADAIFV